MSTKDQSEIAITKRMKSQNTVGKQITTLADQKKFADRESRLVPRKIKETIHSLNNPNQNSKISLMLPEIWLPHLR